MSIFQLLDQVEARRDAETSPAPNDNVVEGDALIGLLWDVQDRSQLDRLVRDVANGDAVADRAEKALRLAGPVTATSDEIETWGYACLAEWVGLARRRLSPGPVLEAFEALDQMAVEAVDQDDQTSDASFRLNGSLMGAPSTQDGELTAEQLTIIHDEAFELLMAEITDGRPAEWGELAGLFSMALQDEPTFGGWLMSPAASWEFDFEPFYNLWRAGVSLWASPEMIEAVQKSAIWGDSSFGKGPATPAVVTEADAEWVRNGGSGSEQALALIASRRSTGGTRLDLTKFGLLSLPPALVVEGGWTLIQLGGNPGLDPSRLSELDRLELLSIRSCELASFDIALPPGLKRISLWQNGLTQWPAGVAAASAELVRLDLAYNQLTEIPDEVAALSVLEDLTVADNEITRVSTAIGGLSHLQNLTLSSNRELAELPEEVLLLSPDCRISLFGTALPDSFQKAKTIGALRDVWGDR